MRVRRSALVERSAEEEKAFRGLGLLSSKPVLYVCNVEEGAAAEGNAHSAKVFEKAKADGKTRFLGVSTHKNEPEVLRAVFQGLRVTPWMLERPEESMPKSGMVVLPRITQPASRRRESTAASASSIAARTTGLERRDGFIPVYLNDRTGALWLELPSDSVFNLAFYTLLAGLFGAKLNSSSKRSGPHS